MTVVPIAPKKPAPTEKLPPKAKTHLLSEAGLAWLDWCSGYSIRQYEAAGGVAKFNYWPTARLLK
jgi:hypothetical protein